MNDDHNTFDGVAHALSAVLPGVGFEQGMASRTGSTRAAGRSSGRATRNRPSTTGAAQGPRPDDGPPRPRLSPVRFRRVLLAITNEGKIGLGVLAGLLIAFAILSAFYFPRRNPDFPGNRLGLFILVSVVLFAGTMVGVVVFAAEEEEARRRGDRDPRHRDGRGAARDHDRGDDRPSGRGDAAAGKAVFASAGCGGCHTLKAAGSSGRSGRISTRRSPTPRSSSTGSRTARA